MIKTVLLSLLFSSSSWAAKPVVCILIHGTWATSSQWHQAGGDFFNTLHQCNAASDMRLITFSWSGKNSKSSRLEAASRLTEMINQYSKKNKVIIIAHSHGTNVAILASHMLAQDNLQHYLISRLYSLGTPVSKRLYQPNMRTIKYLYHFFSFKDIVQPVLGLFERQFDSHERIANIRLLVNDKEPDHSGLHAPVVAEWILSIPHLLSKNKVGNFEQFNFKQAGLVYLYTHKPPFYAIDIERKKKLLDDTVKRIQCDLITRGYHARFLALLLPDLTLRL